MAFEIASLPSVGQTSVADAQSATLLKRAATAAATSKVAGPTQDAKIEKAGKDFESILLGSWLQQAEASFGSVPGGTADDDDDEDAGKDQFQGIAMQSLAGSLTQSGGIGIAKMITDHLKSAAKAEQNQAFAKPNSTS